MTLGSGLRLAGRYRLDVRIGAGGMGEVWRGTDEVLGRTIAVKVMLPGVATDPGFAQRFLTEATAMARVSHPAVASIHDYGTDAGVTFLVMEFVDGESLAELLGRVGRLDPAGTMRVIAQAAEGLQAVHAAGLVHRDVKPANLLIHRDGRVLLTDFGISRHEGASRLTASGAILGTPSYLSPEQVLGQPVGPLTDVYALGLTAYESRDSHPSAAPAVTAPAAVVPAGFRACGAGLCPAVEMCWGGITDIAGRVIPPKPADCATPHYMQTFAAIPLPADVDLLNVDLNSLTRRTDVKAACSAAIMRDRSRNPDATAGWTIEAWPIPTPAGGTTSYLHCVAGKGETTGSVF